MAQILITGFMGAGKTTLLHKFQGLLTPNWGQFLDLDEEVARFAQVVHVAELIEEDGIDNFRSLEKKVLEMLLKSHPRLVLALGGGTINQNTEALMENFWPNTLWLDTPFETCLEHIQADKTIRPLASGPLHELYELYLDRQKYYMKSEMKMSQFRSPLDVLQKSGIIN